MVVEERRVGEAAAGAVVGLELAKDCGGSDMKLLLLFLLSLLVAVIDNDNDDDAIIGCAGGG